MDKNNNISDEDLLKECSEGKLWAWEIFFKRHPRRRGYSKEKKSVIIKFEKVLLNKFLEEKPWAQEIFVKRYSSPVYWAVDTVYDNNKYKRKLSPEDKNDCFQSVLLSFIKNEYYKLKKWEGKITLGDWMITCSLKEAKNYFTSIIKGPPLIPIEDDPPLLGMEICYPRTDEPGIEEKIIKEELLDICQFVIEKKLSNREKLFVNLFYVKELTNKEISEIMNISPNYPFVLKFRIEKKINRFLDIIEKRLSNREKIFARRYWFEGLTNKEISEIMNISIDDCHLIRQGIEKKIGCKE